MSDTPKTLLVCNLSAKTATAGGAAWEPPVFTFGEQATLALRLYQERDGELVFAFLDVTGLTAAIGEPDARVTSGTWRLQIGPGAQSLSNTTPELQWNEDAGSLQAKINGLAGVVTAYGLATVLRDAGSWFITFANGTSPVPLTVRDNTLFPAAIDIGGAILIDEKWQHEVRMAQVPAVFADAVERVLPDQPKVTKVRAGSSGTGFTFNELQALYVPPDFTGTFELRRGFGKTAELRVADTPESIQTALETAFGAGNFAVTKSADFTVTIEFKGDFAGAAQDDLLVNALNPLPGDLTFTLDFGKAELREALRRQPAVTFPLEVTLRSRDADTVVRPRVAFTVDVTIRRPVAWPQLATIPAHDLLRPPSPKDYRAFDPGNLIVGHEFYRETLGDGVETVFEVAHGLDTEDYFVVIRENAGTKKQLAAGLDYEVADMLANVVTITVLGVAPTSNAWVIFVVSAQTVAAFAAGLAIEIDQVNGLEDRLALIEASVQELEDLIPTTPLGTVGVTAGQALIEINDYKEIFPPLSTGEVFGEKTRPRALLPAIHDSAITSLTALPLPSVAAGAGNVYQNNTGAAITVPGGFGLRSGTLAEGGFLGSDGRTWYALTRSGVTNSYFPTGYEREPAMFDVDAAMLRAGSVMALNFKLRTQTLKANTRVRCRIAIEHGTVQSQGTPSPVALNLRAAFANPVALLSESILLSQNRETRTYGIELVRASNGVIAANKIVNGFATAALATPGSTPPPIRIKFCDFDTENGIVGVGFVSLEILEATCTFKY